jgi:dipeptidyl aminopeptidase/acylaminoacyl peptidase
LPRFRLIACAAMVLSGAAPRAASFEEKIAALYRPFEAEMTTLSPDGQHLAYTRNARGQLYVVIVNVDDPTQRTNLLVDEDHAVQFSKEKKTARLRYLRWMSADRLVIVPSEEIVPLPGPGGPRFQSPIVAVNADGSESKQIADDKDFAYDVDLTPPSTGAAPGNEPPPQFASLARKTTIIGRIPGDPDHLLVEAQGKLPPRKWLGPVPTQVFKIDVKTGKSSIVAEDFSVGRVLYDWNGRPRVLYPQPEHSTSRSFELQGATGMSRWRGPADQGADRLTNDFSFSVENYFAPRSMPLGFAFDSKTLLVASNVGRDTFGIYGWNIETRQRTAPSIEHPHFDLAPLEPDFGSTPLVFDENRRVLAGVRATGVAPFTVWLDAELQEVQVGLNKKFPQRTVEIVEWDDARATFLIRVTGGSEPGRTFVFKRKENLAIEFLRRAPWLKSEDLHDSNPFEFDTKGGVHLTGYLTLPRTSRLNPPPLLVYLPAGFPSRVPPEFDREAQIFAGMGFVVARVNHRGATGFGAKHRDAIQGGVDRVPVDDIMATIDWISRRQQIDRRRVAVVGEGFGGYLALRALQLEPDAFRCAVAFNAPTDLNRWTREPLPDDITADSPPVNFAQEVQRAFFKRNLTNLADVSVLRQVERLTKPVFLIVDPFSDEEIGLENAELRSQLRKRDHAPEYLELRSTDFSLGTPAARAKVFRQVEEFFNLNLYDYKVKVGEAKETK